jgi:AraC-like DNA-binding protein
MAHLIKAEELLGFDGFARSLGLKPESALSEVGLNPEMLSVPDGYIRYVIFARLLENSAAAAACPTFGLQLAQFRGTTYLAGPLTHMLRHAQSLSEAVSLGIRYDYVYGSSMHISLAPVTDVPGAFDVHLQPKVVNSHKNVQAIDFFLVCLVVLVDWVSGSETRPMSVYFPHANLVAAQKYADVLGCPCHFGAPHAAIRFKGSDLVKPLPGRDPVLLKMCLSYVESIFGNVQQLIGDRVRLLVRQWLANGSTTLVDLAEGLSMHPKTLQRRLAEEGVKFEDILDDVRRERFLELIKSQDRPNMLRVAGLLGYSEQAALTRSCRRWFGANPREMLAKQEAGR